MPKQRKYKCFDLPFIGVHDCDRISYSGLYVDDLPGISIDRAALLAEGKNATGLQLIRNVEHEAINQVYNDLIGKLSHSFQFNTILNANSIDTFIGDEVGDLNDYHGKVGVRYRKRQGDKYLGLHIVSIEIHATERQTKKYWIVEYGCEPVQRKMTLNCGRNVVQIDFHSMSNEVVIYFDSCGLPDFNDIQCKNTCDSCELDGRLIKKCAFAETVSFDEEKQKWKPQPLPFSTCYNCVCSFDSLICQIKHLLAYPIRLKMGILIMQHHLNSTRCNAFVRNSMEQAAMNLITWKGGEVDGIKEKGEYWMALGNVVKQISGMLSREKSPCITCNKNKLITSIP